MDKVWHINFCSQVTKGATYEATPWNYFGCVAQMNSSNYNSTALHVHVLLEFLCNKVCARSFWNQSGIAALQSKGSSENEKSNSY